MTVTEGTPAARPDEPVPFGPGSLMWEQMGLYTAAIAGNSVFILQVMHPAIGTVVDQRSNFRLPRPTGGPSPGAAGARPRAPSHVNHPADAQPARREADRV